MQTMVKDAYALVQRVEAAIGPFQVLETHRAHNSRTGVWGIRRLEDDQRYYLKTHSRKQRWHPEAYAYRNWMAPLQGYAPELIEAFEEPQWQGILITALDGAVMREVQLEPPHLHAAYRKAGELTRRLHQAVRGGWFGRPDKDGNPLELYHAPDPVRYIEAALSDLHQKCGEGNLLDSGENALLVRAIGQADVFEGGYPVPTAWDSTPGNWLVKPDGSFSGMIDFENMLWGLGPDSFSILFERYFIKDELALQAFFDGYGSVEDPERLGLQIRICCIKMAAADIYWGTVNGMPRVERYGRRLLNRLASDERFTGPERLWRGDQDLSKSKEGHG